MRDLSRDPLHCGGCGNVCATDEVCVGGACTQFFATPSCNTCPCTACGAGNSCCSYPGTTQAVCVSGATCPN